MRVSVEPALPRGGASRKNKDGDNKRLRLTIGRGSMIAALESEKDHARR